MNRNGNAKTKRFSGVPGLEGFGIDIQRFLSNPAFHTREKFALAMTEHENPVGRFYGGEALLDVAAAGPNIGDKRSLKIIDKAEAVLTEAHETLRAEGRHPAFITQAAIDIADVSIRRYMIEEKMIPDEKQRSELKQTVDSQLIGLVDHLDDFSRSSQEFAGGVGVAAELAVRSLLDSYALDSADPFVSVGSLLTEDMVSRRSRHGGKKGNWDISTFFSHAGTRNKDLVHKIQVKNSGTLWQYADSIVPVSFRNIPNRQDPPVDVWTFAHELSRMYMGMSDGTRHELYRQILAQDMGLAPYGPQ